MKLIAYDPFIAVDYAHNLQVELVPLKQLLKESDFITLHIPLTKSTKGLIGAKELALVKPTMRIINTARGSLIDEEALADSLNKGQIAGAGLDVLKNEPPESTCPLLHAKNCFITPHISWATQSARERLMTVVIDNIKAFIKGQPVNVINNISC